MSKEKAKVAKNFSSRMQGARAVWVAVGILALAFLVGVLAPAWYFAGRLVDNNTAVRAIGELQQQPSRMQAALNSIQDRLRARGFVRDSIEQLKRATAAVRDLDRESLKAGGGVSIGGFGSDDDVQATIDEMTQAWKKYQPALAPVANFTAIPYSDSEREGTQLNMDGRELQKAVTNAATQARVYTPVLEKNLAQIIAGLQSSSDSLATALRSVVLIGVGLAAALAALVGYLSLARGKQAAAATAARQQTEDILRTVREGLFLLDADLKIGEIHSDATGSLFQRESIAGITFEDLLRNLVSAEDAGHRHQVRQSAVERAHQGKPDPLDQSAQRSGSDHRRRRQTGQGRDPLPRVQLPPRASRWRDHPRAGVRGRRHRARGSGRAAEGCAGQRADADGCVPLDPARGSEPAVVVPRRLGCGVQDDQRHAARPGARQRLVPPQDRRPVPPDSQHQG